MATDFLTTELEALRLSGYEVELIEVDGVINLLFYDYPLPVTYNKPSTNLLLRLPISYPNGNPDMFWTDEGLLTSKGQVPSSADNIEIYMGKKWRRFSWHPQGWNPGKCNLSMYLEFVNSGLRKASSN